MLSLISLIKGQCTASNQGDGVGLIKLIFLEKIFNYNFVLMISLDIDECSGCGIGGGYNPCPCSDPTPGFPHFEEFDYFTEYDNW